jgi:aspartate/methionine/tyrosine aminotransferase
MAAYNKFEDFVEHLSKKVIDLHVDTLKVYLSNAAPSASADAVKADLAEITAENGYPAGGSDITNTVSQTTGTVTVAAVDVVFTASGGSFGPFQYVAVYAATVTTPVVDPLVNWWDYGSAVTVNDGETFTVDFGSDKLLDLS